MSKKIILTVMTLAIALGGILGTSDKASAAKKSTSRKSIDVIVGYKNYIRKVKTNGKITKLKYNKKYLKLTKKGNKIKFSEAFKAGKTTVTVKCKGCKASKITVKIWKNEEAWATEFSRRYASNKKLAKKYLNNINLHPKYMTEVRKFNKYKKLIIKNYDPKEMAAAKRAAGKYIKVKFYKGSKNDIDVCCGNVVLLCDKNPDGINYWSRICFAISNNYCHPMDNLTMHNYYESLVNTLPGTKILSCYGTRYSYDNIYNFPQVTKIDVTYEDPDYESDTDSNTDDIDTDEINDETTNDDLSTTTTETTVEEDGTEFTTTTTTQIVIK